MAFPVATAPTSIAGRIERASVATDLITAGLLFVMVLGSGLVHLESFPPLWFDEGWTVCVARTWVEIGHYGCLLRGEPAPPSLAAHFPVVASVALSFKLFGVGIWQARMVGLLYTFGAFLFLYVVSRHTFNRPVAVAAVLLLIAVPFKWQIHPLILGRQVMGEMPMLCFLLGGYACLLQSAGERRWLVVAVACWAVAWMTKAQLAPFLLVSLAGTAVVAAMHRDWSTVRRLALLLAGSWLGYRLLIALKDLLLTGHTLPHPPVNGMTGAIAFVMVPSIRLDTMLQMLVRWPEYTLGLAYAGWRLWRLNLQDHRPALGQIVRTMLLLLAGSWLAWFALFCAGDPRYALPGLFIAAPFAAALFYDLTAGFDVAYVRGTLSRLIRVRRPAIEGVGAAVVVVLLAVMGWVALQERYAFRARDDDRDLFAVIAHLNRATPPTALIETYDSELFLFLNHRYTYAPPQTLVEVIQNDQNPDVPITYNPLQDRPDYLVVGDFGRLARFYRPLIAQGRLRLVETIGRYQIYEPVGP
jgi:hypothetical protein